MVGNYPTEDQCCCSVYRYIGGNPFFSCFFPRIPLPFLLFSWFGCYFLLPSLLPSRPLAPPLLLCGFRSLPLWSALVRAQVTALLFFCTSAADHFYVFLLTWRYASLRKSATEMSSDRSDQVFAMVKASPHGGDTAWIIVSKSGRVL